jgi:hypothetical protein
MMRSSNNEDAREEIMIRKDREYVVNVITTTEWFAKLSDEAKSLVRSDPFSVNMRLGEEEEHVRLAGIYEESVDKRVECGVLIDKDSNKSHPHAQALGLFADRAFLDELEVI